MEGQRNFLTVVLLSLIALCLVVLAARWWTLAHRGELAPLDAPLASSNTPAARDSDGDAGAGRRKAADEQQPVEVTEVSDSAAAAARRLVDQDQQPQRRPEAASPDRLDLNSATAAQFEQLPRIGEALAQRIVDYRKQHGRFARVEDLLNVEGIGEATLAAVRELVYVKPAD